MTLEKNMKYVCVPGCKLFVVLALLLITTSTLAFAEVPVVNGSGLMKDITANADILLLDVRSPAEYDKGHIPHAINIPLNLLASKIDIIKRTGKKKIVVYCLSGKRAQVAVQMLTDNQVENVYHLEGDIRGWYSEGFPLVK